MFSQPDDQLFAFAGLWEHWQDDTEEVLSCTFLTTRPNAEIQSVGHHRMPIVLRTEEEQSLWLDPEITEREPLEGLLVPAEDGALEVSTLKG